MSRGEVTIMHSGSPTITLLPAGKLRLHLDRNHWDDCLAGY